MSVLNCCDTSVSVHHFCLKFPKLSVDIFLKKVDNASLRRYGPTYAYILFLTRRDSLEQETFHESLEFFLNFQDADIFHFVKVRNTNYVNRILTP